MADNNSDNDLGDNDLGEKIKVIFGVSSFGKDFIKKGIFLNILSRFFF